MISQIGFTGLPTTLWRRQLNGLTPNELRIVIKDAAQEAGIKINTTGAKVRKNNNKLFGASKVITDEGARMLQGEYGATTARELRDALKNSYKKYQGDGIFDMII